MPVLTLDSLRAMVRQELGDPIVEVELDNSQIGQAITDAVGLINRYAPARRWGYLTSSSSPQVYKFTDDESVASSNDGVTLIRGLQEIIDITGVRDTLFSSDRVDLFDPLLYIAGGVPTAGGLASYERAMGMLEEARRMFGAEVEWRGFWEYDDTLDTPGRVYTLYIDLSSTNRLRYGYECLVDITPDDDEKTGLRYLTSGYEDWTRRYVLERARGILGRALRKFQGLPGPDGSDMQLDGQEMVSESDLKCSELETSLRGMRSSTFPITG